MRKGLIGRCLLGALAGVAADYLAAVVASCALRLGYFMPCFAWLPERVGGEMNAVWLQLMLCMLLGAGIGAAAHILMRRGGRIAPRLLLSAAALVGFLMPAAVLVVGMMKAIS